MFKRMVETCLKAKIATGDKEAELEGCLETN